MKNSGDFKQFAEEDIRPTKFDDEHQKVLFEDISKLRMVRSQIMFTSMLELS